MQLPKFKLKLNKQPNIDYIEFVINCNQTSKQFLNHTYIGLSNTIL